MRLSQYEIERQCRQSSWRSQTRRYDPTKWQQRFDLIQGAFIVLCFVMIVLLVPLAVVATIAIVLGI